MNAQTAAEQFPTTMARIERRAREIASQTGCAMSAKSARVADGKLAVLFESDLDLAGAVVISRPILELVRAA